MARVLDEVSADVAVRNPDFHRYEGGTLSPAGG